MKGIRDVFKLVLIKGEDFRNFRTCGYLGLEKNQEHFNLIAACVNLRRAPALIKQYEQSDK